MYSYDLMEDRKYREETKRYKGPCRIVSKYPDLEKRFPGSFVFRGEASQPFKRAEKTNKRVVDVKSDEPSLVKVHKGGGRYTVLNKTTREPITDELLSKEEAEALCGKDD